MRKFFSWYRTLILLVAIGGLCGCEYIDCAGPPAYLDGFTMPNLITVLNPQDSFDIGDTLWLRIEFPDSFYSYKKHCSFEDSILYIYANITTHYANKQDAAILGFFEIKASIGQYENPLAIYGFKRVNQSYIAEFGVLLNDSSLTSIGIDDSTAQIDGYQYGVRMASVNNSGCFYDDDACANGKKRPPYSNGFFINTSFQGGVTEWKINMRRQ